MSDDEALVGGGNLTAVEAISTRLAEVTRLAERLDSHLCEAGARSDDTSSQAPSTSSPSTTPEASKSDVDVDVDVAAGIRKILESSVISSPKKLPTEEPEVKNFHQENLPNGDILPNNIAEEFVGEDYATATECSTTPIIQSRSASFTTASECGDTAWWDIEVPASDVENVEIPGLKNEETESRVCSGVDSLFDPSGPGKRSEMIKLPILQMDTEGKVEIPEIDRSSASTIVKETIQEKSGKVLKEVTETTTLRVSQSTHFGVTSYKLTSNTVRDNQEHTDVQELQDLRQIIKRELTTNPEDIQRQETHENLKEIESHVVPIIIDHEIVPAICPRKDSSQDSDESSQESVREHSRLLKFAIGHEIPSTSSPREKSSDSRPGVANEFLREFEESKEHVSPLFVQEESPSQNHHPDENSFEVLQVDDSGIETTPNCSKNSKDEEELLDKMKQVSRNGNCGNCEDSKNSNGLINHCLITQRAVRSAARFDFMLGEIC